jgi:quercetin 2,3-dioxygenase
MSKSNSRRNFIQKIAAATTGAVLAGKTGLAASTEKDMEELVIKSIKPLGFQWETQDPFLFCVHHEDFFPKGNDKLGPDESMDGRNIGNDFEIKNGYRMYHGDTVSGFPGHPHRGFETVTIVRKGMVDHTDSLGGAGRYGDGDVQWMTSGKGVQHAEMFPCLNKDSANPMELFQLWMNLPKASKFVEPNYKMLWAETIPEHIHVDANNKKTLVEIVAGKIENDIAPSPTPNSWAADPEHEVAIWNIQMEAGATWELPTASAGVNRTIYFFKGNELNINNTVVKEYHAAIVKADAAITLKSGSKKSYILILQGKPIAEPVVQHGPFVMNTKDEIQQAFSDYQETGFGGWPWPSKAPVHERDQGRFARHSDGKEEIPG